MTDLAAHLQHVGKSYPHFTLEDVDLELPTGSVTGFIGANGAGKSTTIRILMGLVHQDRGEVTVMGQPMPQAQAAAKRDIGYVSEDMRLYKAATLAWHMEFVRGVFPTAWDEAYALELLKRFDLNPAHPVKGLSHGQRVKAALLLALARRPKLLVLDEPTTGLDPVARQEVLAALMEALADESRTVLFSSQNTLDVEQISDQISFIDQGRMVDSGDKETFLERWRRIRLDVPRGVPLPEMPGTVGGPAAPHGARLTAVTTSRFEPSTAAAYQAAGITVQAVEPMTLEEIFVASVLAKRGGTR
ncbi:MAG: ABC transporter ATP-binding protein [Vicinamibacteria bacterium]